MDDLREGSHGSLEIKDPGKYRDCINCHDPHYQARIGDQNVGRFDPARPIQEQCGVCHETRATLPSPSSEDEGCMTCHHAMKADDPEKTKRNCRNWFKRRAFRFFLTHNQTSLNLTVKEYD
jgi:hypothetical protein